MGIGTMDRLNNYVGMGQAWLFETLFQPLLVWLGFSNLLEDAYDATLWLMVGGLQIIILISIIGGLQRWRPVEAIKDRRAIRVDIFYTLLHRLGLFQVVLFFMVAPWTDYIFGKLHIWGMTILQIEALWPGVTDDFIVSMIIYIVIFDLVEYWYHRAQHNIAWLWALHALHHSQRQMTMWTDDRNHVLDDVLHSIVIVAVAQCIGVPPTQFVLVVAILQLIESLSHANVRLSFGWLGERLLVGPRFHREHHAMVRQAVRRGNGMSNNYAVLFPCWDILFRSANFKGNYGPTGIADQLPTAGGRDYGESFLRQQWLGLRRLWRVCRRVKI